MAPDGGFTYAPRETTSPDRVYSDIDLTAATGVVVTSEIPTWAARPLERLVDGLDRTAWWAQGTLQPPLAVTLTFGADRSDVQSSELQSLMRISYAVFSLQK